MDFSLQGKYPGRLGPQLFRLWVIVCIFGLLAAGCRAPEPSQPQGQNEPPEQEASAPQPGGRMVMAIPGEPSNLLPPLASDSASHEVADLIYVSPLRYDKNIQVEPFAAQSFQVADDGKRLLFTLRPGIRWYDGQELTAEDVEFTYKLMIDPNTPTAYAADFMAIKEFKVTGRYSFEVLYDQPFARALATWASAILPKHALMGEDLQNTKYSRDPMGCGPYKLKSWVENQRVTLEANPDYFEGRPYIDEVIYRNISDQATQFMEIKAGNLDFMDLTPPQYLYLTTGPEWDKDWRKYKYLAAAYTYLGYNLSSPLFKDKLVRQALAYAVDKQELIKGALLGQGEPVIGPYKPDSWAYDHDIKDFPHDPGLALKLLAQAGWVRQSPDGPLMKDGKPFSFTIITNQGNEPRVRTAAIIQYQLAKVGIKVQVRTLEWSTFIKEFIDQRRFEAVILGWTIPQDPDNFDVWHSSKIDKPGLNFVGFANPEADALLDKGRHILDQAKRKPIYDRFQEILHEEEPYLFLYAPYALPMVSRRIHGVEPAPAGISWNFNRWWIPGPDQHPAMYQ